MNEFLEQEEKILGMLKTVFDPEIPVNVYDLGLIYKVEIDGKKCMIDMTLTAPNCPVAESLPMEVQTRVQMLQGVNKVVVDVTFDPPWEMSMMSDAAKIELGLF